MSGDKLIGTVIAVNVNPRSGIPKYHQERRVLVGECGLVGDYHNRPIRESFRNPGTFKKNLWHLSLLAQEVLGLLNQDTALEGMQVLLPGSLGENITVSHLGDLADVADGTIFAIGEHVLLEVAEHMTPCRIIGALHPMIGKRLLADNRNRRGLYCSIVRGVGATIGHGDSIRINIHNKEI